MDSSVTRLSRSDLEHATPSAVRAAIRARCWTGSTKRLALGFQQANMAILPYAHAFDFMRFCQRNPKCLPLLEVTDPGDPHPPLIAPGADVRTDLPAYCVYRDGKLAERRSNITDLWRDDHVAFLTGCNFSLDQIMLNAGAPLPHLLREDAFPSQYISSLRCRPAGVFAGPVVVTMRSVPQSWVLRLIEITSRFPQCHGAPVHIGDPSAVGIADLDRVDWGRPSPVGPGDVPMFWACGVTAQAVALEVGIPEMITHAPGHLFMTDLPTVDPAVDMRP